MVVVAALLAASNIRAATFVSRAWMTASKVAMTASEGLAWDERGACRDRQA